MVARSSVSEPARSMAGKDDEPRVEDHIEENWTFYRSSAPSYVQKEVVIVCFIKSPQPSGPSLALLGLAHTMVQGETWNVCRGHQPSRGGYSSDLGERE